MRCIYYVCYPRITLFLISDCLFNDQFGHPYLILFIVE